MDVVYNTVGQAAKYPFYFILVLSILVFVHEWGHFIMARLCKVKVEAFSIGFGPEIFGWHDRHNTRWKFSLIPLGGYVKMYGDADPSGAKPNSDEVVKMTDEQKAQSFYYKKLWQRAAIVFAGPAVNILFAILLYAGLFATLGRPITPPVVGEVLVESAAAEAGLMPGDRIISMGGVHIDRFDQIQKIVGINMGTPIPTVVERADKMIPLRITPKVVTVENRFGTTHQQGRIGIKSGNTGEQVFDRLDPIRAVGAAVVETVDLSRTMLTAVWQLIAGEREFKEMGGPIMIANMSGKIGGDMAEFGPAPLIVFIAMLSINLGLINLFPLPMLDGGHLTFYAIEAIRRRPLSERVQEYSFRIGFALVCLLALAVTWNDLANLGVFSRLKDLVF